MMRPRFNLWIEKEGVVLISRWRARLLEAIDRTGSITAAANELDVPYRRAWERIQEMEHCLDSKLIDTEIGGKHGGGAALTQDGHALLARFNEFASGFEEIVSVRFQSHFLSGNDHEHELNLGS